MGVFREKAIARMYTIDSELLAYLNDFITQQIALVGWRRTDAHGFIGIPNKRSIAIGFTVHSYGSYAHFFCGTHDTECNFTAVGYEDLTHIGKEYRGV
jgi:hypothetical protein